MSQTASKSGLNFFRTYRYFLLSFFAPAAILGGVYIVFRIYPFGGNQIMVFDYWQQYYPFFSDLWHKVRDGASLLWSWTSGGGEYLPLIGYYMASPLNLIALLFPHALLREAMTLMLLFKIGFAGLFFAVYLARTFKRDDISLPVAASLYALCAFTLGFYWNIMWFDTFALFPLVMLGEQCLVREGKFRLFLVTLSLSIAANYYIGFLVCVFVAIMFFAQCILQKKDARGFMRALGLIALCSAIAVGITAVIILPAHATLQTTFGAAREFPEALHLQNSFVDVLGNLIAFTSPTVTTGLPNLYCGMLTVMLAAIFVISPKITLREKLVLLSVEVFLILSCNINVLDYMWHGFHFTNMVPFRFSFMFSFILIIMAYRAYMVMEEVKTLDMIVMAATAAFFILMAFFGRQKLEYVLGSVSVTAVYMVVLSFFQAKSAPAQNAASKPRAASKQSAPQKQYAALGQHAALGQKLHPAHIALLAVILVETCITAHEGVKAVRTTNRTVYPDKYEQVQQLLDMRQEPESDFYRTEFTTWYTINDSSLYGYNGMTLFASTANVNLITFMRGLGLPAWESGNQYYYEETSPLTNAFLNMRYLVSRSGDAADKEIFWKPVGTPAEKSILLENTRYLPLGFMADAEVAGYVHNEENPFLSQNDLFRKATGLDGNLFTIVETGRAVPENYRVTRSAQNQYTYALNSGNTSGSLKWNYRIPENALYFAYCLIDNATKIQLTSGLIERSTEIKRPHIATLGRFSADDAVSFSSDLTAQSGSAKIYLAYLDQELFDRGYEKLADEILTLTEFTDTRVRGVVTALQDGLLYTSIPCEKRWKAFVDGVETEITLVGGAMAALNLTRGTHEIEFRYYNDSFSLGAAISLISLAACAGIIIFDRYRRRKIKNLNCDEYNETAPLE